MCRAHHTTGAGEPKVNDAWREVESVLSVDGVDSTTSKMKMGDHSIFVKVGWFKGRPVKIDIVLSRLSKLVQNENESAGEFALRNRITENARAMIEVLCEHTSEMLQSDVWNLHNVIEMWRGTHFDPKGVCEGLRLDAYTGEPQIASSPLDAVRRLIEERQEEWEALMANVVEQEQEDGDELHGGGDRDDSRHTPVEA
jgi:hypothetical protein